jgi:hypothetical protein
MKSPWFCRPGVWAAALIVTGMVAANPAGAFVPSAKWLLGQAAAKQMERKVRTLDINAEVQPTDNARVSARVGVPERFTFMSPHSMRHETHHDEGLALEVRTQKKTRLVRPDGSTKILTTRPNFFSDFFTLGGTLEQEQARERLYKAMVHMKVDPEVVSLARFDGRVAWLIGSKPWEEGKSQLWLDKETLMPLRLVEVKKDGKSRTEMRLLGYGSAEAGSWFPKVIEVHKDGALIRRSIVRTADKNGSLKKGLFDLGP